MDAFATNKHPNTIAKESTGHNSSTSTKYFKSTKSNETYKIESTIGHGTFGVVYLARIVETGELVALKKVYQDKRYKNRELQIISMIKHPNCIELKHYFYSGDDQNYLNLVMEYIPENMYRLTRYFKKEKTKMPSVLIKLYSYQLLKGIFYLESIGICHRDIKPHNILVDPERHVVKFCDFGSAKQLKANENNISYICTRYYRAPELIVGATNYSSKVDLWSVGCVMAEMHTLSPIYEGDSVVDQFVEIIKVRGTPSREDMGGMNKTYQDFSFPNVPKKPMKEVLGPEADDQAIDLLDQIFEYNPKKRISLTNALAHSYFEELRVKPIKINGHLMNDLFKFTHEEMKNMGEEKVRIIPSWYSSESQNTNK